MIKSGIYFRRRIKIDISWSLISDSPRRLFSDTTYSSAWHFCSWRNSACVYKPVHYFKTSLRYFRENASRYRRSLDPSRVSCLLFIASRSVHRIENSDGLGSNSFETVRRGLSHVRSNSRPTTGGSISKSTSILYFHATASPRRVYTSAIFRRNGLEILATITG